MAYQRLHHVCTLSMGRLRIHQRSHATKSATPFATPPISHTLAALCIYMLGCCRDSPHLQEVHAHALSIGKMLLAPKLRTQQAHNTLSNTCKQLPNTLALWYFSVTPHNECMKKSCKKARHHGYKAITTRAGQQQRLKENQTAQCL